MVNVANQGLAGCTGVRPSSILVGPALDKSSARRSQKAHTRGCASRKLRCEDGPLRIVCVSCSLMAVLGSVALAFSDSEDLFRGVLEVSRSVFLTGGVLPRRMCALCFVPDILSWARPPHEAGGEIDDDQEAMSGL